MTPKSQTKIKPQFPHVQFKERYTKLLFQNYTLKCIF